MTALPRRSPHVRHSTDQDIAVVHAWLQAQERNEVHGTFLCNWNLTAKMHIEGRLLVYVEPESQVPVAYQWGGLVQPGILEVRNDMRGLGIGRVLVEHCLAVAADADEDILVIQCKPSSSIPFWREMGFQLLGEENRREAYAYRVMARKLELPDDGEPVQVTLEWFPGQRQWDKTTPPSFTQNIEGMLVDDEVSLAQRAICFEELMEGDPVVRVVVGGEEWYCNKAKYEAAQDLGIGRCRNGFYFDVLYRPESMGE